MTARDADAHAPTQVGSSDDTAPRERLSALPIGVRIGNRYGVRALLGAGGIGEVYRVYDEQLGEEFALNALRSDFVDRVTLSEGVERDMHDGMPTWIDDDELCYCTRGACRRLNVSSGEEHETLSVTGADADTTWMTPAATCDRWLTTRSDARVTRKKIVNFASRPWRP